MSSYEAGVLGDTTSVMDLGIMLGALVASAAAARGPCTAASPVGSRSARCSAAS